MDRIHNPNHGGIHSIHTGQVQNAGTTDADNLAAQQDHMLYSRNADNFLQTTEGVEKKLQSNKSGAGEKSNDANPLKAKLEILNQQVKAKAREQELAQAGLAFQNQTIHSLPADVLKFLTDLANQIQQPLTNLRNCLQDILQGKPTQPPAYNTPNAHLSQAPYVPVSYMPASYPTSYGTQVDHYMHAMNRQTEAMTTAIWARTALDFAMLPLFGFSDFWW